MTLMIVTLMTGKASKHLFIFLMKLLPCLSHCCRSHVMGFYQQWAFVVLHNLDPDATYPNVICRSILFHNYSLDFRTKVPQILLSVVVILHGEQSFLK